MNTKIEYNKQDKDYSVFVDGQLIRIYASIRDAHVALREYQLSFNDKPLCINPDPVINSVATPEQTALGIEAYTVEVPSTTGLTGLVGWVRYPNYNRQYVGQCRLADGIEAIELLEAKVVLFAADIEEELTINTAAA